MDDQISQSIPPPSPLIQPASPDNKRKFILIGALVFLAFVIALVVLFFTSQQQTKTPVTTPTPTTSVPASDKTTQTETKPTLPQSVKWVNYTSTKLQSTSFPSYTISYPETWTKDVENDGVTDSIVLVKNDYSIKIFQAPAEGGLCVFDDPLPIDNPFVQDFRGKKFVEIVTDAGSMRRIAKPSQNSFTNYTFCMKTTNSSGSFGMPTTYGFITYSVPDTEDKNILAEMDQIIKTLKAAK